jgi:hypothetical protein
MTPQCLAHWDNILDVSHCLLETESLGLLDWPSSP